MFKNMFRKPNDIYRIPKPNERTQTTDAGES